MKLQLKKHHGIVLDVGEEGSNDAGAATFASSFVDPDKPEKMHLFYSASTDVDWSFSTIRLAFADSDWASFKKSPQSTLLKNQAGSFCSKEALTPSVVKLGTNYAMFLAGRRSRTECRRIGLALSSSLEDNWKVVGELHSPSLRRTGSSTIRKALSITKEIFSRAENWEGYDIDCGTRPAVLDDGTVLLFYSNVTSPYLHRNRPLVRRMGILNVSFSEGQSGIVYKLTKRIGPLSHLNGTANTWNESVFCPGYISINGKHTLFFAASTYSAGKSPPQYIGYITSESPYFEPKVTSEPEILISGEKDKAQCLPGAEGVLALDTPSPVLNKKDGLIYLYYAIMDRKSKQWKTALSTYSYSDGQ